MNKFAYDTLGTSRELEAAGMERRQAEAVATAIARREGNLATKSDLNLLRTELKSLRTELKSDVSKVESDIAKVESDISSLRAKVESDISSLRTEVKSDISSLRTEVKSDISEVRSEMKAQFRWAISTQVIAAFAVITLVYAIVQ